MHYKTQNRATGWGELDTPGDDVKRVRDLLHSRKLAFYFTSISDSCLTGGYTEFRTLVDTNDPHRDGMPTLEGIVSDLDLSSIETSPGYSVTVCTG